MKLILGASLSTLALLLGMSVAFPQQLRFEFSSLQGTGAPVCEAYVERLNRSEFANYPFCDRPEDNEVEGFENVGRTPLSAQEVERLYDSVVGLIRTGDTNYLQEVRDSRRQRGLSVPGSDGPYYARENQVLVNNGGQPLFYRLDGPIDIDNDGADDDVVVWKQTGITCGQRFSPINGNREDPVRATTHLVVLDQEGNVDSAKTKAILRHPAGDSVTYVDAQGRERTLTFANRFRTLGDSYGAFVYRGITYFDTFYGSSGDFENNRVDAPDITNTLAVLKNEKDVTTLVCEVSWSSDSEIEGK